MEKGQWRRVREPSLLLSNHPPLWEMTGLLKDVARFSEEGSGVVVVMDAAFLKLAKRYLGIEGIPVDIKRVINKNDGLYVYLRSMVVRKWGETMGVYDNAFRGGEVVEQMRDVLDSGRGVFLFPAGTGNANGKWRSGVGCLTRGIYEDGLDDQVGIGLIFVDKGEWILSPFASMVDFISRETVEEITNNRRLAAIMQERWNEKKQTV